MLGNGPGVAEKMKLCLAGGVVEVVATCRPFWVPLIELVINDSLRARSFALSFILLAARFWSEGRKSVSCGLSATISGQGGPRNALSGSPPIGGPENPIIGLSREHNRGCGEIRGL